MIRESLGLRAAKAGGFITQLSSGDDGSLSGLELLPAAAICVDGFQTMRVLDFSCSPPHADTEIYRTNGVQLLQDAVWYPYAILDEIGSFELVIPQFREALLSFLSSETPCIGVLKCPQEAELIRKWLGLGDKLKDFYIQLKDFLTADSDTLLLPVEEPHDVTSRKAVMQWVTEYAG